MLTAPVPKSPPTPPPPPSPEPAAVAKPAPRRLWYVGGLVAVSALVHGLLLAIPLPEQPTVEEPEPEEIEILQSQAMDVARLPEVAAPESPPAKTEASAQAEPLRQRPEPEIPQNQPQQQQQQRPPRPEDVNQRPDPLGNVEQLPENNGEGNASGPAPNNQEPTLAERLQNPGAYVRDGSPVGDLNELFGFGGSGQDQIAPWLTKVNEASPREPDPKISRISLSFTIDYQLNECDHPLRIPPQTGYLGVVVDANNTILLEVETLGSSGYTLLDDQAKEELPNHLDELEARTVETAYLVAFSVNYDRCR